MTVVYYLKIQLQAQKFEKVKYIIDLQHLEFPACWLIVFNLSLKRSILVSNCCLGSGYQLRKSWNFGGFVQNPGHHTVYGSQSRCSHQAPHGPARWMVSMGLLVLWDWFIPGNAWEMRTCLSFSEISLKFPTLVAPFLSLLAISLIWSWGRIAGCCHGSNDPLLLVHINFELYRCRFSLRKSMRLSTHESAHITSPCLTPWYWRNLQIWSLVQVGRISYSYQTCQLFHRSCLSASPHVVLFHRFLKPLRMCQ